MVKKNDKGFTLVELLIALALSMIGLLGLLALQMAAVRSNANSRNFAEATALAQEKIEVLQSTAWASIASQSEPTVYASPGATQTTYSRSTTVATVGLIKNITVQVSWNDAYRVNSSNQPVVHNVTLYLVKQQ